MRTAFEYCHRNQLQTARLLGISRNIVRARLLQCGELTGKPRTPDSPTEEKKPQIAQITLIWRAVDLLSYSIE
jgi:hypothetical protein